MSSEPVHILGAGLSGLAAATYLANAGREVHVHEIRSDSGARFDGDFQGIENWTSDSDFFDEIREWGFDPEEFKSNGFDVIDLVHPDDEITQPRTSGLAFRVVERGTAGHCIDQGFKRMALDAGAEIHYDTRRDPKDCHIIAAEDDPICGAEDLPNLAKHPNLTVETTAHGGHCGYVSNFRLDSWIDQRLLDLFNQN
jgi:monoamine oxidase